jgi:purine-binding chemotaxis protein CheW
VSAPGLFAFRAGGGLWAVPVDEVLELVRLGPVTRVPGTSDRVVGVVGWRGRTIPILAFEDDLKPGGSDPDLRGRVLVLARPGPFGLLIERPERVLSPGEWEPTQPETGTTSGDPAGPAPRFARFEGGLLRRLDPVRWIGPERGLLRGAPPIEVTEVPR